MPRAAASTGHNAARAGIGPVPFSRLRRASASRAAGIVLRVFTLTDDACIVVKAIADTTPGGRETGGIRIYDGSERGTDFALEPAAGPEDGDVILEQSGAHIYLAPDVADDLSEFVLAASVDPDGVVDFSFGTAEKSAPKGMTEVRSTGGHAH
jgi:hypothetical protein